MESGRASLPSPRCQRSRKESDLPSPPSLCQRGAGRERPNLATIAPSPEEPGGERQRLAALAPPPEEPGQSGRVLISSVRRWRSQEESHRGSPPSPRRQRNQEEHSRASTPSPCSKRSRGRAAAPHRRRTTAKKRGRVDAPRRRRFATGGVERRVAVPNRGRPATKGAEGERSHLTTVRHRLRSPKERDRVSPLSPPPQEEQWESGRSSSPSPRRQRIPRCPAFRDVGRIVSVPQRLRPATRGAT